MPLFREAFGCLLYTGDFRWEASNERAEIGRNTLVKALKDDVVDILYLDNTYCNPSYAFPSREVAAQQVVDIIASHPDHDVIIGIDSLGKEELLFHISHKLNIKIWVWPERLQTMHLLGFHDIFTTKTSLTRVRAVPRYSFSVDTLESLNTMHPTIGIMPSGLPWVVQPLKGGGSLPGSLFSSYQSKWRATSGTQTEKLKEALGSVDRFHKCIYSVPYSDHSCFTEIEKFLNLVQPSNIRGIVSSSSCYVDPLYYFGHLCRANQPPLRYNQEKRVQHKTVVAAQIKFNVESGRSTKVDRKRRTAEVGILGVHMSKVDALRRARRGAKLAEVRVLIA
ncbi:DRMBL domain-containing protein [Citrus sinensis]|nr:DRMBL domain-containing protein [Citrus sinensis]